MSVMYIISKSEAAALAGDSASVHVNKLLLQLAYLRLIEFV